METIGLKGIWGLEQLDRTGIATWKLGVLLMGGGTLVGAMLIPTLGEVNPASVLASRFGPQQIYAILVGPLFAIGLYLFFSLFMARNTEADLRLLSVFDDAVGENIKLLKQGRFTLIICTLIGIIFYPSMLWVIDVVVWDWTFVERFSVLHSSGLALNVANYLIFPILGLSAGITLSIFVTQSKCLVHTARNIEVDLVLLSQYSKIANPLIRLVLFVLAGMSLVPPLILFLDDAAFTKGTIIGVLTISFISILLLLMYAYPILILRNRIKEEKQKELDAVLLSLQGDKDAIQKISIQGHGMPMTTTDLLTHQMFVESRWEWPIASHVQRLILFGLLTPISWVLAATLENVLY